MAKQSKLAKKWHANANSELRAATAKQEREKVLSHSGPVRSFSKNEIELLKRAGLDSERVKLDSGSVSPFCPKCKGPMKLVKPTKVNDTWKPFWGCVNYKFTGCNGSVKS